MNPNNRKISLIIDFGWKTKKALAWKYQSTILNFDTTNIKMDDVVSGLGGGNEDIDIQIDKIHQII